MRGTAGIKSRIRYLRRTPAYRFLRRRVVPRLRNSAAVRLILRRLFAVDISTAVPLDVSAGRLIGGVGSESLPVVLVVMLGVRDSTVEETIDQIARLQLLEAGFRPVIVLDTPAFSDIRRFGYPTELLISRPAWSEGEMGSWDDYVRHRLNHIFACYGATAAVTVGPRGLDDTSRLILGAFAASGAD